MLIQLTNSCSILQAMWKNLLLGQGKNGSEPIPPLPSRLLTEDELKPFYEAIKTYEASNARVASDSGANVGAKRKSGGLGGLDTQHYGRGKRAREVGLVYSPSSLLYSSSFYLGHPTLVLIGGFKCLHK